MHGCINYGIIFSSLVAGRAGGGGVSLLTSMPEPVLGTPRKTPEPLHLYCFLKIQKATHPDSVAMRRISFPLSSITKSLLMTERSGPVLTKEPVQSAFTV